MKLICQTRLALHWCIGSHIFKIMNYYILVNMDGKYFILKIIIIFTIVISSG